MKGNKYTLDIVEGEGWIPEDVWARSSGAGGSGAEWGEDAPGGQCLRSRGQRSRRNISSGTKFILILPLVTFVSTLKV